MLLVSLLAGTATALYKVGMSVYKVLTATESASVFSLDNFVSVLIVLVPLSIALWGALLFQPGNNGAGFAKKNQEV